MSKDGKEGSAGGESYVEPPKKIRMLVYGEQSDQIHLLMQAIARGQCKVELALRKTEGEYGMFASMADVWTVFQKAFPPEGLAVTQFTALGDGDARLLVTQVTHSSGQWLRSVERLFCNDPDAQLRKSEVTLVRRMALCALMGIVDGDDDGAVQKRGADVAKAMESASRVGPATKMEEMALKSFDSCINDDQRQSVINKCLLHAKEGRVRPSFVDDLLRRSAALKIKEDGDAQ